MVMINVLVTGGAGYIGSHALRALRGAGYGVVVYDNFSRGHLKAVHGFNVVEGDTADKAKLVELLRKEEIGAVMHFAAHSQVGESVEKPALYYGNNVKGGLSLLEAMLEADVKQLIFSSSAAVYGEPAVTPITEEQPLSPANPYGETKVIMERALRYYKAAYGFNSVSLRYFNAAGAAEDGSIGEEHEPETHLIPLVLETVLGRREKVVVFGDDYPTEDGTAVRDYIHVTDLAEAHVAALEALRRGRGALAYNLGIGRGYSVLEVIRTVEEVTGRAVPYAIGARRAGDPAVLVAATAKAEKELNWRPERCSLETIVQSAWNWHRK